MKTAKQLINYTSMFMINSNKKNFLIPNEDPFAAKIHNIKCNHYCRTFQNMFSTQTKEKKIINYKHRNSFSLKIICKKKKMRRI